MFGCGGEYNARPVGDYVLGENMKKLTLILTILMIVSAIGGGLTSVAFAATNNIDVSDVLFDLQNSQIAGENFNVDDYGYTDEKEVKLLAFAEYGFAFNKEKSDYNIYLYVYNPSGREIKAERNTASIATVYENGKATDYDKFALKLLSASDGKYARLFYKFKVKDPTKLFTRVAANTNARRYDVGEIELNFGDVNSEAFTVGNYYEYTGYAQGFGADSSAESSLACTTDSIETLELNVKSTFYRHNNGTFTQKDISSVYFGVPNDILTKYGRLQEIKANWFETKTTPQYVFTNQNLYKELYPYLGVNKKTQGVPLPEVDGHRFFDICVGEGPGIAKYAFRFGEYDSKYDGATGALNGPQYYYNQLDWLFYSKNGKVSASEVIHEAQNYTSKIGGELLIDKYSKNLFVAEVDNGRQYGWQGTDGSGIVIDADSKFDVDGFDAGSKFMTWFTQVCYGKLDESDLPNITPIYLVNENDVIGNAETIAQKLYIEESDVTEFLQTYEQNKVEGKKTVLFRFATTDYTAYPLWARCEKAFHCSINNKVGYGAQQTVFLDFDIIWLKFIKAGQATVIPCVSSPIDIFHGLTPPLEPSGSNIWVIVIAALIVVALVVVVILLLRLVFKRKSK